VANAITKEFVWMISRIKTQSSETLVEHGKGINVSRTMIKSYKPCIKNVQMGVSNHVQAEVLVKQLQVIILIIVIPLPQEGTQEQPQVQVLLETGTQEGTQEQPQVQVLLETGTQEGTQVQVETMVTKVLPILLVHLHHLLHQQIHVNSIIRNMGYQIVMQVLFMVILVLY